MKLKKKRTGLTSRNTATAAISVERPVKHLTRGLSFYRVRFKDLDGRICRLDIPRKSFTNPSEVIGFLMDAHADLPGTKKDQKDYIEQAVEDISNKVTLKITDRLGWDAESFVYFDRTFGPGKDTLQLDDDPNRNVALGISDGTVKGWIAGLEKPCSVSDELVVAISIAASGPLYGVAGIAEAAIYHFEGARKPPGDDRIYKSSSGKTTCASAAQSMFGRSEKTDLFGFNMTALAVEETCFSCNNLVVVLDEAGAAREGGPGGMIDPKTLPYRIVGGQGRRRSRNYSSSQGLSNRSWLVPVITTSEEELDSGKSDRQEGARVRMVSVPFPPTFAGGTFRDEEDQDARSELAQQVETTITDNYGVAMPKLLSYLVANRNAVATEVLAIRAAFVADTVGKGHSWDKRYAEKFGILLAAAVIMVRAGIAPWTEHRAKAAITKVYNSSRSLTVSTPQATDALLRKLRKLVASGKHFPRVPKGQSLPASKRKGVWGVVRDIGGKTKVTAVLPDRFDKLVRPADAQAVLEELKRRGRLVKDGANLKRQVLIKGLTGTRSRYICIRGLVRKKPSAKKV